MFRVGKLENIKREMSRLQFDILVDNATRCKGVGDFFNDEFRVQAYYIQVVKSQSGVVFILNKSTAQTRQKVCYMK
jgi:hypothetical protein